MQYSGKGGQYKAAFKVSRNVDTSNYCHEKRRLKTDCTVLNAKTKGGKSGVKPAAFSAHVKECFVSEVFSPSRQTFWNMLIHLRWICVSCGK